MKKRLVACLLIGMPMFGDVYTVSTAADAGKGSLREKITLANANPGFDTIHFDIQGPGPHAIALATALPAITDPLRIDGYTQTGASANTSALYSNAKIRIVLVGRSQLFHGLVFSAAAGGSVVRGVSLGNFSSAISIDGASEVSVIGNYIGIDPSGSPLSSSIGVALQNGANRCIVGAPDLYDRNVIGSNDIGVFVTSDYHDIENNLIGTRPDGISPASNTTGVSILNGNGNTIGSDNVISGNTVGRNACGIMIAGASSSNSVIANFIGIAANGRTPLPNRKGVWILDDFLNMKAGAAPTLSEVALNRIEHNLEDGIVITRSTSDPLGNRFSGNTFAENGALGIDLGDDGVTLNDDGDADTGPNHLQNYPVLESVVASEGQLTIRGTLDALPGSGGYMIQFFHDDACDPSGHGEGRGLGRTNVDAGTGPVPFTVTFASPITSGVFSATATSDVLRETSELSPCVAVIVR